MLIIGSHLINVKRLMELVLTICSMKSSLIGIAKKAGLNI